MRPEFRAVPGFPLYYASDDGHVFSTRPWRGSDEPRLLAGGVNAGGYRQVVLCVNGVRTVREVHTIIAATFRGPRPKGLEVRHLDGNPRNNAASNLRYGTRTENLLDAVLHGTHYNAKKTHCPSGHAYDEANTYIAPTGERTCRACGRTGKSARDAQRRGARVAHGQQSAA